MFGPKANGLGIPNTHLEDKIHKWIVEGMLNAGTCRTVSIVLQGIHYQGYLLFCKLTSPSVEPTAKELNEKSYNQI